MLDLADIVFRNNKERTTNLERRTWKGVGKLDFNWLELMNHVSKEIKKTKKQGNLLVKT